MKLVGYFNDFLNDEVNLNQTRIDDLEKGIDAIEDYIDGSEWSDIVIGWLPQGSWAHKTIIRPVDRGEFDADLLVYVDPMEGWEAKDYVNDLYAQFRESGTYRDMVKRWSHCVTVTYANDKKIDVTPCVVGRTASGVLEVCNRDTNTFERSEPEKYTEWLIDRNKWSGSNAFRKVTRLVKYLRDIKTRFTCSSVLLTTMLGDRVTSQDKGQDSVADVPTALRTIFGRWDDWLQLNEVKPAVRNPHLWSEDFAAGLDQDQWTNMRDKIHRYRQWIDEAYVEPNKNESISKWRRVFGDKFAKDVDIEAATSVSKSAATIIAETAGAVADAGADLIALLKRYGSRVISADFPHFPYMRQPKWRRSPGQGLPVTVRAALYQSQGYNKIKDVQPLELLPGGCAIELRAVTATGLPFSTDFEVQWRITNTDEEARRHNQLRGDFEESSTHGQRWESLEYRGVHIAEAFVIRRHDRTLVGVSKPFYVAIE
ncbi:MAG: nucleotidyltransferase [Mesorhizobium sp.]|uniref:SMODS domain-containing nucleotidyltransferase n=1 Tax=Mesorhizobium sp. TaxID=1871066 RepID=UPI000FE8B01D|nr:nucleotidyltransferase [Mesorhizobium sp.]RWG17186.1 MAG: nucleotidyltransferase [Mesorhizobium sp.]